MLCRAALVIIQNTGTLDLLYLKTESPSTPAQEHPSWIPYLSKASDFKYNKHLWVLLRLLSTQPNVIRCKNGVLAVTGFKVDTIAFIGAKLEEGDELFQIAKLARLAHREIDSEDLWYTLTMGALVDPRLRRARPDDIAGLRSAIILYQ